MTTTAWILIGLSAVFVAFLIAAVGFVVMLFRIRYLCDLLTYLTEEVEAMRGRVIGAGRVVQMPMGTPTDS